MIGKITPLVQVAGRRTWLRAVVGHLIGATLSASALGLALGTGGLALGLNRWGPAIGLVGGTIFLVCAFWDARIIRWVRPSLHRQTPAWCLCTFGPMWGGFAWGVDLGLGWTTHVTFSGYYGLVLWALLGANPIAGTLVLGTYGLGRALPVLVTGIFARRFKLELLAASHMRFLPFIEQVDAAALAFVAGYFLAR